LSFEEILQRMLNRIPNTFDKRQGSIIYDSLAPAAFELAQMYIAYEGIMLETFADTASREYLIKRAAERGITPYPATKAILKGIFNINVPIGSRFFKDTLYFTVTEKISDYNFKLECETAGTIGNTMLGNIIPVEYITGLNSAELTEILIPASDEETTEDLRYRYFNSFDSIAYGGNVADYKTKVNILPGVGGVKVYPTWNGGGTVKLVIINSAFEVPSSTLIDEVQNTIDPVSNQGQGLGIAPIGHTVTVEGVTAETLNIQFTLTFATGWTWLDVKPYVEGAIDNLFLNLNATWQNETNIIVRISAIEQTILACPGVIDITNTLINNDALNVEIDTNKIPVRGVVLNV